MRSIRPVRRVGALLLCAAFGPSENAFAAESGAKSAGSVSWISIYPAGDSERLSGNVDSWIALGIMFLSALVAWSINHERAGPRKAGVILAGLACLGVSGWFAAILASDIMSNPKPPIIALSRANPAVLWLQAAVSVAAGLLLVRAGLRMKATADEVKLPFGNEPYRYGRVSRYLHWTTAILILVLMPMGVFASMIPETVWYRQGYYVTHKTLGLLVLILLLVRMGWNLQTVRTKPDPSLRRWEGRLAQAVHRLLYLLMVAFPITGIAMSTYGGKALYLFAWDIGPLWGKDLQAVAPWAFAHKFLLPYLAYLVIGTHVLGVVKHLFIDRKHDAIKRMVG